MKTDKIGHRIKYYMAKNKKTTKELADQTHLEHQFVVNVLEDNIYPSLSPLLKIARVLGVRLGSLLDDRIDEDPLIVKRNAREEKLTVKKGGSKPVALKFYSLGKGKKDRHMEPFFVELLPESSSEKTLSSHEGEEFIVVYSGLVEVLYGKKIYHLEAGDSIYYDSIVPHYVSCRGGRIATIYAVLHIPEEIEK